jgi:trehalose 6-phosphate phosphatase
MPADLTADRALSLATDALGHAPAGLLTDLDGTLAPIVRDPAAVRLADGAAAALEVLARRLAVVAVLSGRAAPDARRIVGVPGVLVVGNHGTEWLAPDAAHPEALPGQASVAARLSELLAAIPAESGVEVEHKRLSATIHYRNAVDPERARARIAEALAPHLGAAFQLRHGRMSVELRPGGLGDKGTALRAIVERHGLNGLLVLGDDVTDLDMFRATAALRSAGRVGAAIVAVGASGEVPPEVGEAADAILDGPAGVVGLLRALA